MKYYFLALATLLFICVGCAIDGQQVFDNHEHVAPPANMLQRPGPMVDGPGPGVMPMYAPPQNRSFVSKTTQVRFVEPKGMQIGWKIGNAYAENQLTTPGRYNFRQGATYRLKLTGVPGRDGLTLYPTLQVYPADPTTDAYLSHNSVPLELTDEDLDQVESNNFVSKVIYLPDPKFQELAIAGVETLVSTRLDPGVDPVAEADRRGTIMAVLRMGNMDLEMPDQPPMPQNGAMIGPNGEVHQISYQVDGALGHHVPPVPIGGAGTSGPSVPGPMMVAGGTGIAPGIGPVAGMGGMPAWGSPTTATPFGLVGPPHLPLGGPAGLKSHVVRNLTETQYPKPVKNFLIDVKQDPGFSLPKPVKHIQYTEKHPIYAPGQVSYPAWSRQNGGR